MKLLAGLVEYHVVTSVMDLSDEKNTKSGEA